MESGAGNGVQATVKGGTEYDPRGFESRGRQLSAANGPEEKTLSIAVRRSCAAGCLCRDSLLLGRGLSQRRACGPAVQPDGFDESRGFEFQTLDAGASARRGARAEQVGSGRRGHGEQPTRFPRRAGPRVSEALGRGSSGEHDQPSADRAGMSAAGNRSDRDDVNAEIERMAKRFNIPVDQWLKLLEEERNVSPEQYANDIIWPMLALRRIAGERLSVSRQELRKEYETQYGDMVRVRLIAASSAEKAKKLRAQAAAIPAISISSALWPRPIPRTRPAPASRASSIRSAGTEVIKRSSKPCSIWPTAIFRRSSMPATNM